jgi:hypothetical protein
MGSGGTALLFLTSAPGVVEWSASCPGLFKPRGNSPRYPLGRSQGDAESRSEHYGEKESLLPLPRIKPRLVGRPARSPVAIVIPAPLLNVYRNSSAKGPSYQGQTTSECRKSVALQQCMVIRSYLCNRPWRLIGLRRWGSHIFSRQPAHRWRWGCQPYAPATLYPQEDSWYSFMLEAESTPRP